MPNGDDCNWASEALSASRIVVYALDRVAGAFRLSANGAESLGLVRDTAASDWRAHILPEDHSFYDRTLGAITPADRSFEIEYRIRHAATGQQLWVLDRGEGVFDAAGKCLGIRGAIIDISARVSIERELRQATRLRSVVFEAARMAAWHLDMALDRLTCTDELLDLLDIGRAGFDGTLRGIERAIHPADRASWHDALWRAHAKGGRMEIEFRAPSRQGGQRWLLARGEVAAAPDGAPLEAYGVMIDITERKRAEETSSRLASIVASSEDAIISKSLRGIVTSWNSGAERLFGYTAAEMIGEPVVKIIPPENANEEVVILGTIRKGESIAPYETVRVHKNGRTIDVSVVVSPIRNAKGEVIGASTIARDVTERHRHVDTLRENEARLRLALRSARAGAWDCDLQKRELHWSPEMFALYGLEPAAGVPPRGCLVGQIVPAHRKRARMEFARAILQGGSFTLEFPIVRPDGSEIWTALAGDVIKDHAGRPVSARGIDQDITERKNWEKRQAILLRELSHRVKNTLAVIQSVARQTLRTSISPRAFVEAFEGRISSFAASHAILTEADWAGAELRKVIRSQVAPMAENFETQVKMRGTPVVLAAEIATQLGLVMHELATNAAKYGSLSVHHGRVDIVWRTSEDMLCLLWRERGGPAVEGLPRTAGFGTVLIQSSAAKVTQRFNRRGFSCRLEFTL